MVVGNERAQADQVTRRVGHYYHYLYWKTEYRIIINYLVITYKYNGMMCSSGDLVPGLVIDGALTMPTLPTPVIWVASAPSQFFPSTLLTT